MKNVAGLANERPIVCPRCECHRVQIQVTAWWCFADGIPYGQGDDYIERPAGAFAICEECAHQWEVGS